MAPLSKYDRNYPDSDVQFTVTDSFGEKRTFLDFSTLGVNIELAKGLKSSFVACYAHTSVETQRQCWRCVRKFCLFLQASDWHDSQILHKNVLNDFMNWLRNSGLNPSTQSSIFNILKMLLLWCERNHSQIIAENLFVPFYIARRDPATQPLLINRENLKEILRVCYFEIDQFEERMTKNLKCLEENRLGNNNDETFTLLNHLLKLGKGRIPSQKAIFNTQKSLLRKINELGGLRYLIKTIFITPRKLFPYYLVILMQTAGNPMAILELERDCVQPHPLRSDRKSVIWYKRRSGAEQRADFGIHKKYSAPNLIKRLLTFTENLVPFAENRHKNSLFIAFNQRTAAVPCIQLMHSFLDDFIIKYSLENFDFKQFRSTSAFLHHKESRDLIVARDKLNHKSARTTLAYTQRDYFLEEDNELIAKSQNALIDFAFEKPQADSEANVDQHLHSFPTVFGFDCKNPYQGIAPGSSRGHLCLNFSHCANCAGSLVLLDDSAVVARLRETERVLEIGGKRAIEEGWADRFNALYSSTLKIIQEDLLPKVSPFTWAESEKIRTPPIPPLE